MRRLIDIYYFSIVDYNCRNLYVQLSLIKKFLIEEIFFLNENIILIFIGYFMRKNYLLLKFVLYVREKIFKNEKFNYYKRRENYK